MKNKIKQKIIIKDDNPKQLVLDRDQRPLWGLNEESGGEGEKFYYVIYTKSIDLLHQKRPHNFFVSLFECKNQ